MPTIRMLFIKEQMKNEYDDATSDEEFSKDLDKCNEYVQAKDVFAFPFGLYNERNVNLLKEKGFTLAFNNNRKK